MSLFDLGFWLTFLPLGTLITVLCLGVQRLIVPARKEKPRENYETRWKRLQRPDGVIILLKERVIYEK